ncbi:DUF1634 domain-containing protein [Desulfofundulus sp. TPOSR]|uniref:DUF1634 domain-containing protein n=1 Tax=Desulfofundulus sp. TPOSR TaxID=2714340 RepID=UPI001407486C|nr:DUF1634 domain-containing protein [Desulfofundulus sp. TPOSR]NHM27407.1 DUF1634 domain-containing protein [Desulfofundulus sp. TPOSR]
MAKPQAEMLKSPAPQKAPAKAPAAPQVEVAPEQLAYANVLLYGSWLGIALLLLTNIIYLTGLVKPYIEPAMLPQYWGMKASEFVQVAHMPTGWGWFNMLGYSDFLNFIGMALLAALTIVGYLILLPAYLSKKDVPYTFIVLAEVVVLVLAASGVLAVGGH